MIYVQGLLLFSVLLQSVENFFLRRHWGNYLIQGLKIVLCILIFLQLSAALVIYFWFVLLVLQFFSLAQFRGNLNGASDAMTTISLFCMALMSIENEVIKKFAFYYLILQLGVSYFIAGVVKIRRAEWRNGTALNIFLEHAFYKDIFPARLVLGRAQLIRFISWAMMLWEISFPIIFFVPHMTIFYLAIGFIFHLLNALIFGLHRFFWAWIAAYPLVFLAF